MRRQEEPPAWLAEYEDFVAQPVEIPSEPTGW